MDNPLGFTAGTGHWLVTLATSLLFSAVGLAVPNFYQQKSRKRRSHNGLRFTHEFLGKHLLIYVTFFMALGITAEFRIKRETAQGLMLVIVAGTFLAYTYAVYAASEQDEFFDQKHGCANISDCDGLINSDDAWKLLKPNAVIACALFVIAFIGTLLVM